MAITLPSTGVSGILWSLNNSLMNLANINFSAFRGTIDQAIERAKSGEIQEAFHSHISQLSRKQKALITTLVFVVFGLILVSPAPKNVRPVNVHARSISVAWVLPRPTFGCVALIPKSFNARPKIACNRSFVSAHLTELSHLRPQTTYRIMLLSGLRPLLWGNPSVTTTQVREEMPDMPKPGYGSVVFKDEKIEGALVLVYTNTPQAQYAVAALTNSQGNYAVDLANLSRDGNSYVLDSFVNVNRFARLEADIRLSTPFPPLLLHDQVVPWGENLWLRFKGAL